MIETVLPLLAKGDRIPVRMPGSHLAWRLCNWFESFREPIQLVSDHVVDWHLIQDYCQAEFSTFPAKIQGQVWRRSEDAEIKHALEVAESEFWLANPGMVHHALYDARRLKLIADRQRDLLDQGEMI